MKKNILKHLICSINNLYSTNRIRCYLKSQHWGKFNDHYDERKMIEDFLEKKKVINETIFSFIHEIHWI